MRAFIAVTVAAGIFAVIVLQKQRATTPPQASAGQTAPAATPKAPAAAPSGQASAHNFPKRALDRAADVKRQVAEQRKGDETR